MSDTISRRITNMLDLLTPTYRFFTESAWTRRIDDPAICDFVVGNP
jgi:hypothetical protein